MEKDSHENWQLQFSVIRAASGEPDSKLKMDRGSSAAGNRTSPGKGLEAARLEGGLEEATRDEGGRLRGPWGPGKRRSGSSLSPERSVKAEERDLSLVCR